MKQATNTVGPLRIVFKIKHPLMNDLDEHIYNIYIYIYFYAHGTEAILPPFGLNTTV
jgi:hypothetical protein